MDGTRGPVRVPDAFRNFSLCFMEVTESLSQFLSKKKSTKKQQQQTNTKSKQKQTTTTKTKHCFIEVTESLSQFMSQKNKTKQNLMLALPRMLFGEIFAITIT